MEQIYTLYNKPSFFLFGGKTDKAIKEYSLPLGIYAQLVTKIGNEKIEVPCIMLNIRNIDVTQQALASYKTPLKKS